MAPDRLTLAGEPRASPRRAVDLAALRHDGTTLYRTGNRLRLTQRAARTTPDVVPAVALLLTFLFHPDTSSPARSS